MQIATTNVLMAGTIAAQAQAAHQAEAERQPAAASNQQRQAISVEKAESASGIGKTDGEEHTAEDRDADGRLPWERRQAAEQREAETTPDSARRSRDPDGIAGSLLDLCG